jgi:hypothetical protein
MSPHKMFSPQTRWAGRFSSFRSGKFGSLRILAAFSVILIALLLATTGLDAVGGSALWSRIWYSDSVSATGPLAGSALEDRVEISWSTSVVVAPTTMFTVRRDGTLLGVVASTQRIFEDNNAIPGRSYQYCIATRDATGVETSIACDAGGRVIARPSGFQASDGLFEDQVQLTWTDHSSIEAGFNIYRDGGNALMFDGVDDYLSNSIIDVASSFTFEFWAKRGSLGTPDFVLNVEAPPLGDPVRHDLEIGFTADNRFSVGFGTNVLNSTVQFTDLDWQHWAVVWDSPNRRRLVFRNGELVMSDNITTFYAAGGELEIGRRRKAGNATMRGHYHGQLDEIRLWTRPLTRDEIISSMNTLVRNNEPGLANYWPFDATSGNVAVDVVGGRTATLRNMAPSAWVSSGVPSKYARTAANITAFSDRTAVPGFVYTYRIAAFQDMNGDGRYTAGTDFESEQRTDTGWRALIAPPGTVAASDGQFLDRVRITWVDRSASEEGFRIYRGETLDGKVAPETTTLIGTVAPNATTFDDLTGAVLTNYSYCVTSFGAGAESIKVCDLGRAGGLSAPENVSASRDEFDDRVRVRWEDPAGTGEGYEVFRSAVRIATVGLTAKEHIDLTAAPGVEYDYCVRAFSNADPLRPSYSEQSCAPTKGRRAAILAPRDLTASYGDFEERVDLRWRNPSSSAMLFLLYRDGELFELLDQTRTTTADKRLASDVDVQYCVGSATVINQDLSAAKATVSQLLHDIRTNDAAMVASGLEPSTIETRVATVYEALGIDLVAGKAGKSAFDGGYIESDTLCAAGRRSLNQPQFTSITNDLESHVRLEWSDLSSHEVGYVILRAANGGAPVIVDSLSANRTTFSDFKGVPGQQYTYSVRAFDDYGYSKTATGSGIRTLKAPTAFTASNGVSETIVRLAWRDNSTAETGYRIYRKIAGGTEEVLVTTTPRNEVAFNDLVPDTLRAVSLSYRLVAFDGYGESEAATATGQTSILPPLSVSASNVYRTQVVVVWTDQSAIEDSLLVRRRPVNGRDFKDTLLVKNSTRFVDLLAEDGIEYSYCVQSVVRANGMRVMSSPACAQGRRSFTGTAGGPGTGPGDPGTGDGPVRLTDAALLSVGAGSLRFGQSISVSGGRLLVGIPGADDDGAASIYGLASLTASSIADITLQPTTTPKGAFGRAVALSGNFAIVGDPLDNLSNGAYSAYKLDNSVWGRSSGRAGVPNLGHSVAIVDSFAVIGDNKFGASPQGHGRAIFCNLASDPSCASTVFLDSLLTPAMRKANMAFGQSVGITRVTVGTSDSLYVVVGAPGDNKAYVFECRVSDGCATRSNWALSNPIESTFTGGQGGEFGDAVAIDQNRIVVGDPVREGIAIWTRSGKASWTQSFRKRRSTGEYGRTVSIRGGNIVVGAPAEKVGDRVAAGAVYVYLWDDSKLDEVTRYDARVVNPPKTGARFGTSIAQSAESIFVGAPMEDNKGAVYAVPRGFTQQDDPIIPVDVTLVDPERVRASDGTANDRIQIRWVDKSENEAGHVIYRSDEAGGFDRLGDVSANIEFYDDMSAAPGEAYTYCVAAFTLDPYTESGRSCDIGWRPPNGAISGRVFTAGGAGTDDAIVCLGPSPNRGLLVDGVAGHILVPLVVGEGQTSPLSLTNNFTIEAWIKPQSASATMTLISRPGAYRLHLDSGKLKFTAVEDGGGTVTSSDTLAVAAGVWSHVAVVRDALNKVSFYVNGTPSDTDQRSFLLKGEGADSLFIGQKGDNTEWFHGEIDEVRIWSIARTASEVAESRFKALIGREESLLAYWPMDEGRRRVVPDLTRSANHGLLKEGIYLADRGADLNICAATGSDGNYSITRIRYGLGTEFDLIPTRDGRTFAPTFKKISLSLDSPVQNEVFFNDVTAYTVAGSALYRDTIGETVLTCPVPGVSVHVTKGRIASDDNLKAVTVEDGSYSVSVDPSATPADTWSIIMRGPSTASSPHTFQPSIRELAVMRDTFAVDFFSTKRNTLSGYFSGGDPLTCAQDIGTATIRIYTQDGCYDRTITVNSKLNNGKFTLDLPPQEYLVQVISVENAPQERASDIADFFKRLGAVEVDLRDGAVERNLTYRAPLTLQIAGLAPACPSGITVKDNDGNPLRILPAVKIIEEFDFVPLTISVTENYGNGNTCAVGEGNVIILDAIADRVRVDSTMAITDGEVKYTTQGASPNIFSGARIGGVDRSFQKPITVVAQIEGRPALMETEWAIVNGFRERAATFVSATTSEIPLMILHDPPGSNSVAFIEEGSTHCTRISNMKMSGSAVGGEVDVQIGFKQSTGFSFGAHFEIPFGLGLKAKTRTVDGRQTSSLWTDGGRQNIETCWTTTRTLSTSDDPGWVGEDLVMGVAFNLIFALADVLKANEQTCTLTLSETLATDLDQAQPFETTYVYGRTHIADNVIPQLTQLIALGGDVTLTGDVSQTRQSIRLRESILNWQKQLNLIDRNKDNMTGKKNFSFSGGMDVSRTESADTTRVTSFESTRLYIDSENAIGLIFAVGFDSYAAVAFDFNSEWVSSEEKTESSTHSIGYTLSDNDGGDYFSVDIGKDPRYGTFAFKTVAGRSSNPCEENTQCRDNPIITVDPPVRFNVPAGGAANFQLSLINASESNERRRYVIDAPPERNPFNLMMNVAGGPFNRPREYLLDPGKALTVNLDAYASPSARTYKDVAVMMYPPDEWPIWAGYPMNAFERSDTAFFSVYFDGGQGNNLIAQMNSGWNWFSINRDGGEVGALLGGVPAVHGDLLRSQRAESRYDSLMGWTGDLTRLVPGEGYRIRLQHPSILQVAGDPVGNLEGRELSPGWSWIGYVPTRMLPVDAALRSLTGRAMTGDIIVGQRSFAQYVKDIGWVGTLRDMNPGESYAVHLEGGGRLQYPGDAEDVPARLPYVHETTTLGPEWIVDTSLFDASMTIVAEVQQSGRPMRQTATKIAAVVGEEVRGTGEVHYVAALDRYLAFIVVNGEVEGETPVVLHVFDGEANELFESVATINYSPNARLGQPSAPVVIDVANAGGAPLLQELPEIFALHQNFPNPFNAYTVINYDLPEAARVRMVVYDLQGRRLATLVDGDLGAGRHRAVFDAAGVASGVYFYRMEIGQSSYLGKMIVVK